MHKPNPIRQLIVCTVIISIPGNNQEVDKPNENSDKTIQKKSLPELDKYWKAVNDDPNDFTAWTYLLQYVEQEVNHLIIISKLNWNENL